MAETYGLSQFTFDGELIQSVSEMVFDYVVTAPDINSVHTIYDNIVMDKEIGFIGAGGLAGKAAQGCDPTAQTFSGTSRLLKWEPEEYELLLHLCYTDLKGTIAEYSLKTGTQRPDFTSSDYMNITQIVLERAMNEFIFRTVWFGDTDADTVANGGILTNGTDKTYFNLINGFFKQMETQVTANSDQLVTITENAGASYAAQALDPDNIQGYFESAYFNAPAEIEMMDNRVILCTRSVYNAYAKSLSGLALESMYVNLTEGVRTLAYQGIPLISLPEWDRVIKAYEDNGTTLNNPHRFVYTSKDIIGVGVDSTNSFRNLDVWYDKDTRKVKIEAMGSIDAKLMNPELFMIGTGAVGS